MCKLVEQHVVAGLVAGGRDPAAEQVLVTEDHAADVLHRPGVVLRNEHLVVLPERVSRPELLLEHPEPGRRGGEDAVGVEVLGDRLPAEDRHRHVPGRVLPADADVLTGDQRGDVGGDRGGLGEVPPTPGTVQRSDRDPRPDGLDRPGLGRQDREGETRLEIGLFEVGEHPPRVGRLELGVEVDAAVARVDEAVQPLAAAAVGAAGRHLEGVRAGRHPGRLLG